MSKIHRISGSNFPSNAKEGEIAFSNLGVIYIKGKSNAWTKIAEVNKPLPNSLNIIRELVTDNLNDVVLPGIYLTNFNIHATKERNYPATYAGMMEVISTDNGTGYVYQRYTILSGQPGQNNIYTRGRYLNVWSPWKLHRFELTQEQEDTLDAFQGVYPQNFIETDGSATELILSKNPQSASMSDTDKMVFLKSQSGGYIQLQKAINSGDYILALDDGNRQFQRVSKFLMFTGQRVFKPFTHLNSSEITNTPFAREVFNETNGYMVKAGQNNVEKTYININPKTNELILGEDISTKIKIPPTVLASGGSKTLTINDSGIFHYVQGLPITSETDPTVPTHVKNISATEKNAWNLLRERYLPYRDIRTIKPNSIGVNKIEYGFSSFPNNSTSPYSDFIHFGGYTDASGGKQNLILFNKGDFGIRQYQGNFQADTPYSSYVDYWHSGNLNPNNYLRKNENVITVGFSSGNNPESFSSEAYPYFKHTDGTFVKLAARVWVTSQLNNYIAKNSTDYVKLTNSYNPEFSNNNLNELKQTGFYRGASNVNAPNPGWYYIINQKHSDESWYSQIALSYGSNNTENKLFSRVKNAGNWSSWKEYIGSDSTRDLRNVSTANPIVRANSVWFDYNWANIGEAGSVINFSGLGGTYNVEIFANYVNGNLKYRTHNGDVPGWSQVKQILTKDIGDTEYIRRAETTLTLKANRIAESGTNNTSEVAINFYGYNESTAHFRNFRVFDGKTNPLFGVFGESRKIEFYGKEQSKIWIDNSNWNGGSVPVAKLHFQWYGKLHTFGLIRDDSAGTRGLSYFEDNTEQIRFRTNQIIPRQANSSNATGLRWLSLDGSSVLGNIGLHTTGDTIHGFYMGSGENSWNGQTGLLLNDNFIRYKGNNLLTSRNLPQVNQTLDRHNFGNYANNDSLKDATYGIAYGIVQESGSDCPTDDWYNKFKILHGNSSGYYTELAMPFNHNQLYYRRMAAGSLHSWVKIISGENITTTGEVGKIPEITSSGLTVNQRITATSFFESSSINLKENITDYKSCARKLIDKLNIVKYDRVDTGAKNKIGIIAEHTPKEFLNEERSAVDLYNTIFIMSKAIQELNRELKELRAEVKRLKQN